ncbi:MAG: lipoxygenase family protein [Myxococcota bacterium]
MTAVPTLPQDDPTPTDRAADLVAARARYTYSFDTYPGVALVAQRPKDDTTPPQWSKVVDGALTAVLANERAVDRPTLAGFEARMAETWHAARDLVHEGLRTASNDLAAVLLGGTEHGDATSLDDFRALFRTVPVPDAWAAVHDDVAFSRRWLAGSNPESLQRVRSLPDVPLSDAQIAAVSPGDQIAAAIESGRLYEVDYRMLDGLPPNELGPRPAVLAPARGFLVRPWSSGVPRLFAIQLRPGGPVFTPADGWGWRIARTHLAAADTVVGAIWHHHARTHLVAEPLFVAAHRSLAPRHPLMVLLAQHAEGTLYINEVGAHTVFAPHGLLDWFTGTSQAGVRELARRSLEDFDFLSSRLPERLVNRGVSDPDLDFPYRDDARLVWDALQTWVTGYVALYYRTDADVAADGEVAAWVLAASSADGGGIRGLGGPPRTRANLVDLLTNLLFGASALHAAMNFPVAEELTVIPASPFGAWSPVPDRTDGWTEADWLRTLPPLDAAQRQLDTALLLGMSRVGSLGDYPDGTFVDPRVAPVLAKFRADLATAEQAIADRNRKRKPYVHLMPSRIPPGINI